MTLRQTIQAAPAKTDELIRKLANTSNQALKTREGLFGALTSELSLYMEVEEQHLLPMLRKHPETKALASDVAKGNKELRAQLSAISAMPKGNDQFLAKVAELKKSFQQHVRDERNELLPAVLKALSDDEAAQTAEKMEAAVAEADGARRAAKHAEAAEAKRKAAEAHHAGEDERAAADETMPAQGAAEDATRRADETSRQIATIVQDGGREVAQRLIETDTTTAPSARDAITLYSSSENLFKDLRAVAASSTVAFQASSEIVSAWTKWVRGAVAANLNASRKMMECSDFADVTQVQREFMDRSLRTWLESQSAVIEITEGAIKQALTPFRARTGIAAA